MKRMYLIMTALLISSVIAGQTGALLRLNPEKNKVYRMRSVSEQTIVQTVNGNQQTIESKTVYSLSMKMVDATQSFIVSEIRFDTLSTFTNTMGKTSSISSVSEGNIQSEETSEIMSYIMNRLSKSPLYVKMEPTGKVLEIINGKMVSDMIVRDTSQIIVKEPLAAALKTQIPGMVSADAMKTIIETFITDLPGKPVSTGESWTSVTTTNAGGMSLDISTKYVLENLLENSAMLKADSEIKASPNARPMESGGATITYGNLRGLSKSTVTIDPRTGLPVVSDTKTHISGNLDVSVAGMNMQIPMDINSTSKVTSIQ